MADHPPLGSPHLGTAHLDAAGLKALAHPLRVRLLGALRATGPATASALGRKFGETSGATSYHLRRLAEHGFVEEEVGRGTARERWWRAAHRTTSWPDDEQWDDDPAAAEAGAFLRGHQARYEQRAVRRWEQERAGWPAHWQAAATASDVVLRLRADQLHDLAAELNAVIERWTGTNEDWAKGEHVAVFVRAFPLRDPVL